MKQFKTITEALAEIQSLIREGRFPIVDKRFGVWRVREDQWRYVQSITQGDSQTGSG